MKLKKTEKKVNYEQIQRAVASSTAIETGTSVKTLEAVLKERSSKFQHLKLAS